MVTTGNSRIKMPVPNIPMPLVEAKDKANAVQVKMANVAAIGVMRLPVLLPSWVTSLVFSGSLPP